MLYNFSFKRHGLSSFNIFNFSKRFNIWKEILMHCLFFTLNILVVSLVPLSYHNDHKVVIKKDNTTEYDIKIARPQSYNSNVLGWITVTIYITFKLTNELQKVYMLCGLVRSPLYSSLST